MSIDAPLDAAEALARTPLFAGLSSVDLARLVPELEERRYEAGEVVFSQGDPPDGLYVIRTGEARVVVREEGGETVLAALGPPEYFGEMALISADARSATVQAATPLEAWRLPTERFAELIAHHTELPLEIAAALSRRLAATDRELSQTRGYLQSLALEALPLLPAALRDTLLRGSPLREIDPIALGRAMGRPDVPRLLAALDLRTRLLRCDEHGRYQFADRAIRRCLYGELARELGEQQLRGWHAQLAEALEATGDRAAAIDHYLAAEAWGPAARLLAQAGPELLAEDPAALESRLRWLPAERLAADGAALDLLARCCLAQGKPREAVEAYEHAIAEARRQARSSSDLERSLARLYVETGRPELAFGVLRSAIDEANTATSAHGGLDPSGGLLGVLPGADDPAERLRRGGLVLAGARALARATVSTDRWRQLPWGRGVTAIVVFGLLLAAWFGPTPPGLSQAGLRAVVLLAGGLAVSLLGLLPDFLTFLLMLALWVVGEVVPARVAASGFSSPTWFLMLATMGLGVGLARSGLLYRAALELLQRLPPRYPVLAACLAGLGVLLTPGMPYVGGRVSLAGPIAQDMADSLRYPPRGGGTAGLALATLLGFGLMGPLFLTGNPMSLILYGLLPADIRAGITFGSWFLVALPFHLVTFVGMLAFILWRYRPAADSLSEQTLQLQRAVLGRVGGGEWLALAILLGLLVGFSTQPLHGIGPAWLGLGAVAIMIAGRLVDTDALRAGVNWPLLLYLGVTLSLGEVFREVGLDAWLANALVPLLASAGLQPDILILGVAGLALLSAIILGIGPAILLLALALFPIAAQLGLSPWIVGLTLIVSANQWLYPQMSVVYLSLYYASEERAFTHAQARPAALAYALLTFVGLLVSIPYWRSLGLLW